MMIEANSFALDGEPFWDEVLKDDLKGDAVCVLVVTVVLEITVIQRNQQVRGMKLWESIVNGTTSNLADNLYVALTRPRLLDDCL